MTEETVYCVGMAKAAVYCARMAKEALANAHLQRRSLLPLNFPQQRHSRLRGNPVLTNQPAF